VRNGSISNFQNGVDLSSAAGTIVEGLRVLGGIPGALYGITARGIVKGNTASDYSGFPSCGISATGTVTGNYATGNRTGFCIGAGSGLTGVYSTVIGNTAVSNFRIGFDVSCPSNSRQHGRK
jgi:hypothetical protein